MITITYQTLKIMTQNLQFEKQQTYITNILKMTKHINHKVGIKHY